MDKEIIEMVKKLDNDELYALILVMRQMVKKNTDKKAAS